MDQNGKKVVKYVRMKLYKAGDIAQSEELRAPDKATMQKLLELWLDRHSNQGYDFAADGVSVVDWDEWVNEVRNWNTDLPYDIDDLETFDDREREEVAINERLSPMELEGTACCCTMSWYDPNDGFSMPSDDAGWDIEGSGVHDVTSYTIGEALAELNSCGDIYGCNVRQARRMAAYLSYIHARDEFVRWALEYALIYMERQECSAELCASCTECTGYLSCEDQDCTLCEQQDECKRRNEEE